MWCRIFVVGLALCCLSLGKAFADERLFTYSYEAEVLPKGQWEFEQWVTLRAGKEDGQFHRWDFREEMEYGLTDRLTTALYLNFSDIHNDGVPGIKDKDNTEFKGISSEWKYLVFSPHQYPIGLLLYFEPTYDGEELELEEKIILQHNFGERLVSVVNIIFEEEWEFSEDETETEGVLALTAGLSYRLNDNWAVGLELRNHREYPEFEEEEHSAWFLGPNIHYRREKWWATLTILPQITDILDEHEEVEVRLLAGIFF